MNPPTRPTRDRRLNDATAAMQMLGGLFALLGVLPLFLAFTDARGSITGMLLSSIATLVLVGPGVWYFIGSFLIRKGIAAAIDRSLWIAAGQAAVVGCGSLFGLVTENKVLAIPAFLGLFFLPALAAMCWHLTRARRSVREIASEGHGFQPVKIRPVLPVDETANSNPQPHSGEKR